MTTPIPPSISVIIPTCNRPRDVKHLLQSLIIQSHQPQQLIVVDQSDDVLTKQVTDTVLNHSCIALTYVHDPNIAGLVPAKEHGVQASTEDIVLFLDDDVILEVDFIEQILLGFVENSNMQGCCGVATNFNASWCYRMIHRIFHRGFFYDKRHDVSGLPSTSKALIPSTFLSGGLSAFRREVFEQVHFDTQNGFFILEDVDFSTRAARVFGVDRFFINPKARLEDIYSSTNRPALGKQYAHKVEMFIRFYKKNVDMPWILPCLIWLLFGISIQATVLSVRRFQFAPLAGYFQGLCLGIRTKLVV